MSAPQNNPRIKRGLLVDRPLAGTVPEGMIYVYTDPALAGVIAISGPTTWADVVADGLSAASFGLLAEMAASVDPTTNVVGIKNTASRVDHSHFHGNLPGQTLPLHALATPTPGLDGFMSAADKLKLDSVFAGFDGPLVGGTVTVVPGAFALTAGSAIMVTRRGVPTAPVGFLSVASRILGIPGVAQFTVKSYDAAGVILGADNGSFDYTIVG